MIRSIAPAPLSEPGGKPTFLSLRATEGFGERVANDALEQQTVAVKQADVVALGSGTRTAANNGSTPPPAPLTYSRPPPSSVRTARSATPAARAETTKVSETEASEATDTDATKRASPKLDLAEINKQLAANTLLTQTTGTSTTDSSATMDKLVAMRNDALTPPPSVADLAIATAAALRISELVRARYAAEQAAVQKQSQSTAPAKTGDRPSIAPTDVIA